MEALAAGLDPSKIPLAMNPDGSPPNFIDPPSLGPAVIGVGVATAVISAATLTIRLFVGLKTSGKLCLDDYLCLLAELVGITYWIIYTSFVPDGTTRHDWDIPLSVLTPSLIKFVLFPATWAAKAAVLVFYIRIFGSKRWIRIISYFLMFLFVVFYGSNMVVAVIFCTPPPGDPWDARVLLRCNKAKKAALSVGIFSVAADLIIFIMPIPIILKLNTNRSRKVGLALLFFTGFLIVVTSAVGLAYKVKYYEGKDASWNGTNITIVSFTEIFGTVIVSCVPSFPYFCRVAPSKTCLFFCRIFSRSAKQTPTETSLEASHRQMNNQPARKIMTPDSWQTDIYSERPSSAPHSVGIKKSIEVKQRVDDLAETQDRRSERMTETDVVP